MTDVRVAWRRVASRRGCASRASRAKKKTKRIRASDPVARTPAQPRAKAYRRSKLQSRLMAKLITDSVPRTVARHCIAAGLA